MRIEINAHIVIDSEICHGKPTFRRSRVMVWQVLEMLEAGAATDEILEAYPSLARSAIRAALHYATGLTRGNGNAVIIPFEA